MKKFIAIIITAAAFFAGSNKACALTQSELVETIELLNKECPSDLGDGLTMQSISLTDTSIIIKVFTTANDEVVNKVALNAELLGPKFAKGLSVSPKMREIFALCKANGIDYIISFYNENGTTANLVARHTDM